jgi:hypothetical protein
MRTKIRIELIRKSLLRNKLFIVPPMKLKGECLTVADDLFLG